MPAEPTKPVQQTGSAPRMAYERLSDEMKDEVQGVAVQVSGVMEDTQEHPADPGQAIEIMEMFCASFPDDEDIKPAIWSCLDSKVRTAITRYQKSLRGA